MCSPHGHRPRRDGLAAERGAPVAVHADRRLRVPVGLPHRRARRARRDDRLALRAALRRAERVRQPARPAGRRLPARPYGVTVPDGPPLRARDERARHDLARARRLGRGARRAHHRAAPRPRHDHAAHPPAGRRGRRPRCSCDASRASTAPSRSSWCASRCSTTAERRPSGRSATTRAQRRRDGCRRPSACAPTWRSASRAAACARRHVLRAGERLSARSRGPRGSPRRPTPPRPSAADAPRPRSGATGSTAPDRSTIAGASRSSARR